MLTMLRLHDCRIIRGLVSQYIPNPLNERLRLDLVSLFKIIYFAILFLKGFIGF